MHAGHCFFEQAVLFVAVAVLSVANAIIVDGTGHETASLMIRTPTKLCQEANARIHAWLEPSIIPSVVCHFRPFGKRINKLELRHGRAMRKKRKASQKTGGHTELLGFKLGF